jgi:biopolymer transport protein ExbD
MSGGGGEAAQPRSKGKGKKRKKSKRLGVRIDMTPLVDVAFLLLTFFMLTTSMARPQTMEINLPPDDVKVEIAESNLMTLRVNEKGEVFWNIGLETPAKIEFTKLRGFIRERGQANSKLVTLVKIDPKAKYEVMVNIMDELNQADMQRFSVAKMTDQDKTILAGLKS